MTIQTTDLDIDLSNKDDDQLFEWLIACLLFAKPVQQNIAADAFKELKKSNLVSPGKLRESSWQRIVDALGRAHYVRYDESTATRLKDAANKLRQDYDNKMTNVLAEANSTNDLKKKLQEFNGMGPKAAEIFLRDAKHLVA